MFDTDVFVAGGGPAGLAASIAARQSGLRVVVADGVQPAVDKACGEGLMPDSLHALALLGIAIPPQYGFHFRGIRFDGASHSACADFPRHPGLGLRRTVLHDLMMDHARTVGVEMLWATPVTGLDGHSVYMGRDRITSRWIVAADGAQSRLRHWTGLDDFRRDSRRFSYRKHFRVAPWSGYMQIHWAGGCQMYVTPVAHDEVCVVLMTRNPHERIASALRKFPQLQSRFAGAGEAGSERGALAATRILRHVTRGNVALIGDASGTVDPITGEGLCLAFHQALALARALRAGDLTLYERAHAQMARRPRFMADFMLLMDHSAFLCRRTLAAFETHPHLFSKMLAMHVGALTPVRFAATAAALGWKIATA